MNTADKPPVLPHYLLGHEREVRIPLYPAQSFVEPAKDSYFVFPRVEAVYRWLGYTEDGTPVMEYAGVEVFGAASNENVARIISDLLDFAEEVTRDTVDELYRTNQQPNQRLHLEAQHRLNQIKRRLIGIGVDWKARKS